MSPRLKYQRLTENESSTSRSSVRSESTRRQSIRPTRKTTQNPSQTGRLLIRAPPKAPGTPRAIFHATCGPVHASVTLASWSSTLPVAISPALPDHTPTVQLPVFGSNVAAVIRPRCG